MLRLQQLCGMVRQGRARCAGRAMFSTLKKRNKKRVKTSSIIASKLIPFKHPMDRQRTARRNMNQVFHSLLIIRRKKKIDRYSLSTFPSSHNYYIVSSAPPPWPTAEYPPYQLDSLYRILTFNNDIFIRSSRS